MNEVQTFLDLLLGAALGGLYVALLRPLPRPRQDALFAAGLGGAALVYVPFALAGAAASWVPIEVAGFVAYTVVAVLGARRSRWLLAFGWAGHALWDFPLHAAPAAGFVPGWYPAACLAFDVVVAGYLAASARAMSGR